MHKEVSTRRRHHPQAKGSVDKKIRNPLERHSLEKHADITPHQDTTDPKPVHPAQDTDTYFLCPSTKLSASSVGTQSTVLVLL